MTDDQIDEIIMKLPIEGFGLVYEMPQDMTGSQFRTTLRRWGHAIADVSITHERITNEQRLLKIARVIADVQLLDEK